MVIEEQTDDELGHEKDERAGKAEEIDGGGHDEGTEREAEVAAEGEDADVLCAIAVVGGAMHELCRLRMKHGYAHAADHDRRAKPVKIGGEPGERHAAACEEEADGDQPGAVLPIGELPEERLHDGADEVRQQHERRRCGIVVMIGGNQERQDGGERALVDVRAEMPERHQIFVFSGIFRCHKEDLFFMFVSKLLLCYDYRTKMPRILAVFCILGTFSHTSRCPIADVLRTWLLDGSAAVNVDQSCCALLFVFWSFIEKTWDKCLTDHVGLFYDGNIDFRIV